jgi:hypothetical protein
MFVMHETQVTLLGDGCDSYFGMSGAPVFERDVLTGERQIRGVISYALCPSKEFQDGHVRLLPGAEQGICLSDPGRWLCEHPGMGCEGVVVQQVGSQSLSHALPLSCGFDAFIWAHTLWQASRPLGGREELSGYICEKTDLPDQDRGEMKGGIHFCVVMHLVPAYILSWHDLRCLFHAFML